jgi:mRNA interferase MazF
MGRRPALVLSPSSYNGKVGLALLCPITRRAKGYPFEVQLPGGVGVESVVLSDQVKSLDWRAGRAERIARVSPAVID